MPTVKTFLATATLVLLVTGLCSAAEYRHQGDMVLNDLKATPGDADKKLLVPVLCSPSFKTAERAHVSPAIKAKVCQEYNITDGCPGDRFQIDRLISFELGGTNDIRNLWPEPYPSAHQKDCVENKLEQLVCNRKVPLRVARQAIATNWLSALRVYAPKCK